MSLIKQEIEELRELNRALLAGEISPEILNASIKTYKETEKRVRLMLDIASRATKERRRAMEFASAANIIDGQTAIAVFESDHENERVRCPGLDGKTIRRAECLDYSGELKFDECDGCKIGNKTRDLLLSCANTPKIPPINGPLI